MELLVYNTPEKNMLAAEAAAEELCRLEGKELRRQTRRVTELLRIANEQQKNPRYTGNAPSASPSLVQPATTEAAPETRRSHPLLRQAGVGTPRPPMIAQAGRAG
jgi:hypothetical protein